MKAPRLLPWLITSASNKGACDQTCKIHESFLAVLANGKSTRLPQSCVLYKTDHKHAIWPWVAKPWKMLNLIYNVRGRISPEISISVSSPSLPHERVIELVKVTWSGLRKYPCNPALPRTCTSSPIQDGPRNIRCLPAIVLPDDVWPTRIWLQ